MSDNNKAREIMNLIVETNSQCSARGLDDSDRFLLFELGWLCAASNLRNAALALPGGFPHARDEQVNHLNRMIDLVRDAEPDLEAESLFQEGDLTGFMEHVLEKTRRSSDVANATRKNDPLVQQPSDPTTPPGILANLSLDGGDKYYKVRLTAIPRVGEMVNFYSFETSPGAALRCKGKVVRVEHEIHAVTEDHLDGDGHHALIVHVDMKGGA